jgi:RNA recognition motif-containing protein
MGNKSKNKDIFVGEISFEAEEEDLEKLFSVCGTVRSVRMLTDANSGQFTGRAFVRMATDAEAKEAVNMLDGARLINRCISVCAAREKQEAQPAPPVVEEKIRRRRQPKGRRK